MENYNYFLVKCRENGINEMQKFKKFQSSKVLSRFSINIIWNVPFAFDREFRASAPISIIRASWSEHIDIFQTIKVKNARCKWTSFNSTGFYSLLFFDPNAWFQFSLLELWIVCQLKWKDRIELRRRK